MKLLVFVFLLAIATHSVAHAQSPSSAKTKPAAQQGSTPGWLVDVRQFSGNSGNEPDLAGDVLTRIVVKPSAFSMQSHTQSFFGNNTVSYQGSAIFNPKYSGAPQKYVFYMASPNDSCAFKLSLGGRTIIDAKSVNPNRAVTASAELDKPPFSIQFVSACMSNSANIIIKVRGADDDMSPRDFHNNELYISRN